MNETYEEEQIRKVEPKAVSDLLEKLPEMAAVLIENRPENVHFKENPDDPAEHEAVWHQFGIITHTRKFCQFYRTEAQEYLNRWGLLLKEEQYLKDQIDGVPKDTLLQISMPLHDLGKFARGFKDKDGKLVPEYKGHEAKSEQIIQENSTVNGILKQMSLTEKQIDYIARCAGLHYELGKLRDTAKQTDLGYSIAFSESPECHEACTAIAQEFPEFQAEIGLLFLCDSLAKTDIRIDAEKDAEIESQSEIIEQQIAEKKLNPKLVGAVKQRPVNIAIAKKYLESLQS